MRPTTIKLCINALLQLTTLIALIVVTTSTYNYVEGTIRSKTPRLNATIKVRYGLMRTCSTIENYNNKSNSNLDEECEDTDFDAMTKIDFNRKPTFGKIPTSGNPELEMIFVFVFYGFGAVVFPIFLLPFCLNIKDKYYAYASGAFAASGIGCIIFGTLFPKSIIEFWEDGADKTNMLQVSLERSYSFYLHIVLSCLLIVVGIASVCLVKGYDSDDDDDSPAVVTIPQGSHPI